MIELEFAQRTRLGVFTRAQTEYRTSLPSRQLSLHRVDWSDRARIGHGFLSVPLRRADPMPTLSDTVYTHVSTILRAFLRAPLNVSRI